MRSYVALTAAISLALLFALPGCGGKKSISISLVDSPLGRNIEKLSRDFTSGTGVNVEFRWVPEEKFREEVLSGPTLEKGIGADLIIGDIRWLGVGVSQGRYAELTDWLKGNENFSDVAPAALKYLSEYPPGSGRYYSVPCAIDLIGFAYRKDLFEDPRLRRSFKREYRYELRVPETYGELRDIARFFTGLGRDFRGIAIPTNSRDDAIVAFFQQLMWSWGGDYGDFSARVAHGHINSSNSIAALKFFIGLAQFSPKDSLGLTYEGCLRAFEEGKAAMVAAPISYLSELSDSLRNPYAGSTAYFISPGKADDEGNLKRSVTLLGDYISISSYTEKRAMAESFLSWLLKPEVQRKLASMGTYVPSLGILGSGDFLGADPLNGVLAGSLQYARAFPAYSRLPEILEITAEKLRAAVSGEMGARTALDQMAGEYTRIFQGI